MKNRYTFHDNWFKTVNETLNKKNPKRLEIYIQCSKCKKPIKNEKFGIQKLKTKNNYIHINCIPKKDLTELILEEIK